jgi:Cu(I)/Ag(I) efflux system membrane protein CusA/SilA
MRNVRGSDDELGPILVPAIVQRQIPNAEPATIRGENGGLTAYGYADPMNGHTGSLIPAANHVLRIGADSPLGNPISFAALGETIWQADLRMEIIVPLSLAVLILLIQMAVRALTKTRTVLLTMPFFAIGAIWSIWVMHYNLIVSGFGSAIALFSIYAEVVALRLFYREFSLAQSRMAGLSRPAKKTSNVLLQKAGQRAHAILDYMRSRVFGNMIQRRGFQNDGAN